MMPQWAWQKVEKDLKPVPGMPLSIPCLQEVQLLPQAPQAAPKWIPVWQWLLWLGAQDIPA